jgi:antitoxin component YwqK of YwqJK toxin-antitoxin module
MAREYNPGGTLILVTTYRNGYFQKEEKINRVDKLGLKQGLFKDFYDNDQAKTEGNYKDDKKDGIFKEYSMDGRVIKKEEYRNGELLVAQKKEEDKFEVKRQYYETGATKIVGTYKKGVPEGVFRQYDEKGNLAGTKVYHAGKVLREGKMDEQGREQGEWKEFYESGHVKSIGNYIDGKREGNWKFSFENDSLEQTGVYKKGKPTGPWKWYYPNGELRRDETYTDGKENGYMKEYDEKGDVIAEGNYIDGKQDGDWKFSNGEYVAQGKFIEGKEDGIWKQYYRDGKLAFEGDYVEGQESGEHKYYYPNGRLAESRTYRLGVADKIWKKFDSGGAPVLQITYQNGDETKWDEEPVPEGDSSSN